MTRDPFDVLERQLHDSVQRRTRVRRVHRRGLLAVAAALTLGGGIAGASVVLNHDGDDDAVRRALTRGSDSARRLAVCAASHRQRPVSIVPGRPSAAVLRQLRIFRRPATPGDRVPDRLLLARVGSVLRESIRVARASDGTRYILHISRGASGFPERDPVGCYRTIRDESIKAASSENAAVRARVQRITTGWVTRVESIASGRTESLSVIQLRPNARSGGAGATYIVNGRIPAMGSSTTTRVNGRPRIALDGLIPDGISSIRLLDRSGPRARRAHPITVRVRDNVYHLILPRRMGPRMTAEWRDRQGHVIRRVHPRY